MKNDVLNYVEACVTLFWNVPFAEFSVTSNLHFILGLDLRGLAKLQNSNWAEVAKSLGQNHAENQSDVAIFATEDSGWDWNLLHWIKYK